MSFGRVITEARKKAGISQKDLAGRIKKEDGTPISPQYLNDLERDRRNPPAEHLLNQLADHLELGREYLCFVAGQFPEDLRNHAYQPERVQAAFQAFRRTLQSGGEERP